MGLEHELESEREARTTFDRKSENPTVVCAEIIRRVVRGESREVVERESCAAREEALQGWTSDLSATAHVARGGNHIGTFTNELCHRGNVAWIICSVRDHRDDHISLGCREARPVRIEHAFADRIVDESYVLRLRLHCGDCRDGIVLGKIVDDECLVRLVDHFFDFAQEPCDILAFVIDGYDDGDQRRGHSAPGRVSAAQ